MEALLCNSVEKLHKITFLLTTPRMAATFCLIYSPTLQNWVVLENNNGLLTQLVVEGLPLLRSSLQQDVHASCQEVDPAEPGSADVQSVRRAAR